MKPSDVGGLSEAAETDIATLNQTQKGGVDSRSRGARSVIRGMTLFWWRGAREAGAAGTGAEFGRWFVVLEAEGHLGRGRDSDAQPAPTERRPPRRRGPGKQRGLGEATSNQHETWFDVLGGLRWTRLQRVSVISLVVDQSTGGIGR